MFILLVRQSLVNTVRSDLGDILKLYEREALPRVVFLDAGRGDGSFESVSTVQAPWSLCCSEASDSVTVVTVTGAPTCAPPPSQPSATAGRF